MVGVRTSNGCDACRQRKKKCGEERPVCQACVSSGWQCPGYGRSWRFVDQNDKLAIYYRKRRYLFDTDPDGIEQLALEKSLAEAASLYLNVFSICRPPRLTSTERAAGMFAFILTDPKCQSVFSPQAAGSFFPFIPSRLGRNAALDAAISCLCDIYNDILRGKNGSAATTKKYVASLEALQVCVADPILRIQSETICASLIIQIYELMLGSDTSTYDAMLRGSRALIQEAGPKRFHSGFDRAMLELVRAPFIAQDMANPGHCFLSEPTWRNLPENHLGSPHQPSLSIQLRNQLSDFLVEIPGLMAKAFMLLATPIQSDQLCLTNLAIYISGLIRRIELWYETDVLPNICSRTPERTIGMKYTHAREYADLLLGVVDCVTCALLNKLDDLTASLDDACNWQDLELSISRLDQKSYSTRRQVTLTAFMFVKAQSEVTAKQLIFGLGRLGHDLAFVVGDI